jgi:hypothetical protein
MSDLMEGRIGSFEEIAERANKVIDIKRSNDWLGR